MIKQRIYRCLLSAFEGVRATASWRCAKQACGLESQIDSYRSHLTACRLNSFAESVANRYRRVMNARRELHSLEPREVRKDFAKILQDLMNGFAICVHLI